MSDWVRNHWDYIVVTPPASTPITLAEVKEFLRIDTSDDDALLTSLIEAAVACGEGITRRIFITTGFRTFRNGFSETKNFVQGGELPIVLRKSSLIDTTLFTYKTDSGTTTLVKDTDFFEEIVNDYSKLRPEDMWPSDNKERVQSITIEFDAGYGPDASDVPADIKTALQQHVCFLYNNRGDCNDTSAKNSGAMFIYLKYKIMEV